MALRVFAVEWAVVPLLPYLEACRFTVHADHDALSWILELTDWTLKLGRWRPGHSEFEFDVVYRAGTRGQGADALSLLKTTGEDETAIEDDILYSALPLELPSKREGEVYVYARRCRRKGQAKCWTS